MINPQQGQYQIMMTIIPFILVIDFFILYFKLYNFLFVCFDCAYDRFDDFDRKRFGSQLFYL